MPGKNGEELMNYVYEHHENIPFIFISGFLSKEIIMKLIDKGAVGLLDKPFNEEDLIRKVKRALILSCSSKLIEVTIDTLLGSIKELESSLKKNGKDQLLEALKKEVASILDQRKILEKLKSSH